MQRDTLAKRVKRGQTNMLSNKRGCPRRKNANLYRASIVPLDWSMEDTLTIKKNSSKGLRVLCIKDGCEPARDSKN